MDDRWSELARLADVENLDGVLAIASVDEIAEAWHRYNDTPEPKDHTHRDWWAVELLMTREIHQRRALHRELLLALVAQGSDEALGVVGAGPLEDFISNNEADLVWLESQCVANSRMRSALNGVWVAGSVSRRTLAGWMPQPDSHSLSRRAISRTLFG